MYTVDLHSHGNPDLAQYTSVREPELAQAANLGAGNWPVPVVYEDGEPVGNLTYNLGLR